MGHEHQRHAGALRSQGIDLAIAHHHSRLRLHGECRKYCAQHPRVRFAEGQGIPAPDAGEVLREVQFLQDRLGEVHRLVGAHREHGVCAQELERRAHPGIGNGGAHRFGCVVAQERALRGGAVHVRAGPCGERARHQLCHALAYHGAHLAFRERRAAEFPEHGVDRVREVRGAVDEGAVEVEDHECGTHGRYTRKSCTVLLGAPLVSNSDAFDSSSGSGSCASMTRPFRSALVPSTFCLS